MQAAQEGGYLIWVYGVYAVFAIGLTVWLARTLFTNGAVFLKDVFVDQPELAQAVNRLLVVGFYLFNFGYACLLLESYEAATVQRAVEVLAQKAGYLLISLGVMHFINMALFHRIRRRARLAELPPPVAHHAELGARPRTEAWTTVREANATR